MYVDSPLDICLARKTLHMLQNGRDPQASLARYLKAGRRVYIANVRVYRYYADIVVDGTQSVDEIAQSWAISLR